jgi:hypothetical protein
VKSLYFRNFSASFLITFLSPEIATFINIHVLFPLSRIIMSGLLLELLLLLLFSLILLKRYITDGTTYNVYAELMKLCLRQGAM